MVNKAMSLICRSAALSGVLVAASIAGGMPARAADPPATKPAPKVSRPADTQASPLKLALQLIRTDVVVPPVVTPAVAAAPAAGAGPTVVTVATPTMLTLDGTTASFSVSGGDLGYNLSLSPTIAADGKLLVLWNLRLNGKSLPGATGVSATGAVRVEMGKSVGIAEVSLTDPATGRMATFRLQGIVTTGEAVQTTVTAAAPAVATPATP